MFEATVTEELNQKVVEVLTTLADQYDRGHIGPDGLKTGLRVIYTLTNGLVTEDVAKHMAESRDFMDAELARIGQHPVELEIYWRQGAEPVVLQHVLDTGRMNVITGFNAAQLQNNGVDTTGQPNEVGLAKQHRITIGQRLIAAGYTRIA